MPESINHISLSFLVEDMTKHWGGVAANIAFTIGKFGLHPKLMGTVGRDFNDYRDWLEKAGVDTSTVTQIGQVFTASFFANTDLDNNQIASFYSGAMAYSKNIKISDVLDTTPDLVVISPNDPGAMSNLAAECRERQIKFIYDPSQQLARLDGETIKQDMDGAHLLIINAYEADMICAKTGLSMDQVRKMIDIVVVTRGDKGSSIFTNGDEIKIPIFKNTMVIDPTGAGDAYRAGFITGLAKGIDLETSGKMGALCACYVLEQIGTQNHNFSQDAFIKRFRTQFDDNGQLAYLSVEEQV
ncbi:carbohydrate kinase family protein [Anaerolineales bacterium]